MGASRHRITRIKDQPSPRPSSSSLLPSMNDHCVELIVVLSLVCRICFPCFHPSPAHHYHHHHHANRVSAVAR
jgi:hypothetical protein